MEDEILMAIETAYRKGLRDANCAKDIMPYLATSQIVAHEVFNKFFKVDVIGSVCEHSWFPTTKDYKRAWKCSECKKVVHDKHLR